FMNAAREKNNQIAPQYLNTPLQGQAAAELAQKLRVVLDTRLPARLNELSDRPEGSLANPLQPDRDVIGTISTAEGPLELVVERVTRGRPAPVWLFSRKTLDAIPDVYDEINRVSIDRYVPAVLSKPRILGIRLIGWLALAIIIPILYGLAGFVSRLLR